LSEKKGGGSLTALPIVETQLGDVSSYIPTNVISITDGQIYLETDLFAKGQRPAVNIGLSVSRVGSTAQTKAMKKVASQLKLDLAQYQELAAFVQFAQDLDVATRKRIDRGARLVEVLKQGQFEVLPMEEQVCLLFATNEGYLDEIPVVEIGVYAKRLLEYVRNQGQDVLRTIKESRDLIDETKEKLKQLLHGFK